MSKNNSDVNVRQLILWPALIAFSITIVRLVGELAGDQRPCSTVRPAGVVRWLALFGWFPSSELISP